MKKELRILILEDVPTDIELMEHELRKGGIVFTSKCVETKEDFLKEIKDFRPDLILSDYSLPRFDGISALEIVKEQCPGVPFILVSGAIGEELAIETIKSGATDYVLKDRLSRLVPSVLRAIREVNERDDRKRAEEALRESEGKFNAMLQSIGDHMSMMDKDLNIIWANETAKRIFGNDIIDRKCYEAYHRRKEPCEPYPCLTLKAFQDGKVHEHDTQVIDKDGKIIYFHCTANVALRDEDGKPTAVIEISRDITRQKQVEEQTKQLKEYLQLQIERMPIGLIVWDTEFRVQSWNPTAEKIFGFTNEEAFGKHPYDFIVPKEIQPHVDDIWHRLLEGDMGAHSINENKTKDGRTIICEWSNTPFKKADGTVVGVLSMVQDVTERKLSEEVLRKSDEELKKRVKELEEFYQMAVGRELKMIELKKELEGLKEELEKYKNP